LIGTTAETILARRRVAARIRASSIIGDARGRIRDPKLGVYGLLTLAAASVSALWLASSPGTSDPTHALVYGLSAVLVLAFGSATLLQARGAPGAAAAIGATALLATSPALTYLAGTNATTLLLPLVAVIIAMPYARGIRGAAVGVITVAVAVLDLALSPFALLPVAGQDPTVAAISAGASVAVVVLALWRQRHEIERSAQQLEAATMNRTALLLALRDIEPGDSPERTASAIVRELADTNAFQHVALVTLECDQSIRCLAGWPSRNPRAGDTWGPSDTTRRLGALARGGPWIERSTLDDAACVETGPQAMERAFVPIEVRNEPLALLIAGMERGNASAASRIDDLSETAAVAAALIGPALEERRDIGRLRDELAVTIAQHRFAPIFQPIVDLETRLVIGYEALTRFADGMSPDRVFADAIRCGLALELEEATLLAAVEASRRLPMVGFLDLNVSPGLLLASTNLRGILQRAAAGSVVLEITEHVAIPDYTALRAAIAELGDTVRLAVDDAGAGYASLRHILELKPSVVKVDRGIVAGVDSDPARQAVLAGMVHFAQRARCSMVAEGVETESERATLLSLGITLGQGWLFGGVLREQAPITAGQLPQPVAELAPRV
jgi:EAL domain-containing protein (putative c-di-GMP-specific phosphodiesterase class I)